MSIKTQKYLRFVPIINIITVFMWIRSCCVNSIRPFDFVKELLKILGIFVLITVVRIIVAYAFRNSTFDYYLTLISTYFYFLTMSWFAVGAQIRISNTNQKES